MAGHEDEEIPYFSPVAIEESEPVSTQDENDYSTLKQVKQEFEQTLQGLYKDFNAFDLSSKDSIEIKIQIGARQLAFDILEPLRQKLKSAIDDIKEKNEGQ